MMTGMLYHFPRTRFVDENSIYDQVRHIMQETAEAEQEFDNPSCHLLAQEIMDIYHSAETALRILKEKHGVDIHELMMAVYEKNNKRGYYS